jgi:ribosomal protein L40E
LKQKPTKMSVTQAIEKRNEWGMAIIAGFAEGAIVSEDAKRGNEFWCCGKCGAPVTLRFGVVPKVCSKCGSEFDWGAVKTRVIKVCPKCDAQGSVWDTYCTSHAPAVALVRKEIPI